MANLLLHLCTYGNNYTCFTQFHFSTCNFFLQEKPHNTSNILLIFNFQCLIFTDFSSLHSYTADNCTNLSIRYRTYFDLNRRWCRSFLTVQEPPLTHWHYKNCAHYYIPSKIISISCVSEQLRAMLRFSTFKTRVLGLSISLNDT